MTGMTLYILLGIIQYILIFVTTAIAFKNVDLWAKCEINAKVKQKIAGCLTWVLFSAIMLGIAFAKTPLINTYDINLTLYYLTPFNVGGFSTAQLAICIIIATFKHKNYMKNRSRE